MCGKGSLMGWTHEKCKKKWGMDGLTVIYDYEDEGVRKIIDGIKYNFNRELVDDLLKDFVFEIGEKIEAVVPVPLYFYRENWRGFNQAGEIGEVIGAKLFPPRGLASCEAVVPSARYLLRKRNTVQQVKMKSREEREINIRNAFAIDRRSWIVEGGVKSVLVVDDVFTSGADMRECAKVLKKAGVETGLGTLKTSP
jgi:predicted amidophosphoribosyltransferase